MSTKTSIKRIALVAVSALGFGLLSVAPSQAEALTAADTVLQTTATLDNPTTTYAGRVGQQVSITIRGDVKDIAHAANKSINLSVAATITAQPAGSSVYLNLASASAPSAILDQINSGLVIEDNLTAAVNMNGSASTVATINYTSLANEDLAAADDATLATLTFTPTQTGVYTVVAWNENDRTINAYPNPVAATAATTQAALSGSESYQTFTINVVSGVSTIALAAHNSTCAKDASITDDDYGCLVKVTLKDAGGNLAIPATGESVVLTPSGKGDVTYVNNVAVASTGGAAYSLSAADFGQTGEAWINVNSVDAETFTITATYAGSASASVSLTTRTVGTLVDLGPTAVGTSGWVQATAPNAGNAGAYNFPRGVASGTFYVGSTYGTTATYGAFFITDTDGRITGNAGYKYAPAATVSDDVDGAGTDGASVKVSWTTSDTADDANIFTISPMQATQRNTTISTIDATAGAATATPTTVNAVAGATNTISVNLKDNFKRVLANKTLSASVTGRNPTTVAKTAITDALGNASFSFTDANTTSVIASDTISITGGVAGITVTILYGAANAPATITLTSTGDTDVIPGTTTTDIDASATGATGKSATASAVVKNSAGSTVAGVPVTFTVTGLVGAEVHTTKATVYTDTTGKAVSSISSYAAGKATVTATAGTATASDDIYFSQQTILEARTIAVAATGGLVTATVKDRYGNVIEGVNVYATRSGTGYFGSGASTASGKTDKNGQVEFNFVGTGTVTVQLGDATAASATYGQSYAAAGYDADAVNGTAITAYTAGTSATNQKGLGGSLSPAGINSASVAVSAADASVTAAEAATDAAAEAIDAANAATDAANLAAEAADAATVAAEEARDAADAATAAVEELATQVATLMAALKAQITTLANTVAKIAKKVKA